MSVATGGDTAPAVAASSAVGDTAAGDAAAFLIEAGALLAAPLDEAAALRQLADLLVPRLADWCVFDMAAIDGSGAMTRPVVAHADPTRAETARVLAERYPVDPAQAEGLVVRVLRSGVPHLAPEVTDAMLAATARDAEHLALLRSGGIRSSMVVPLTARGRVLGAITLIAAESGRRYGPADLALAETLARRAGLTVDNARLLAAEARAREAAERAAERMAHLQAITAALAGVVAPAEVARIVVGQGVAALGARAGAILLPAEGGQGDGEADLELEIVGAAGYPEEVLVPWRRVPVAGPYPAGEAFRTRQPVWLASRAEWSARYPALGGALAGTRDAGDEARAAVPLLLGDRAVGVMVLTFPEARPADPDDLAFALALTRQCAQAVERARLFAAEAAARAEAEGARRRAAFLAEASAVLAGSLDADATLAQVAHLAVPHLADWCAVDVRDDGGAIRRLAEAHVDPATADAPAADRRALADPFAPTGPAYVLRAARAELVTDAADSPAEVAGHGAPGHPARPAGLTSTMAVPLLVRGRAVAAISFGTAGSGRRFGPADLALAEDLARRAAVAVDNALLFRAAQDEIAERVRAEEALRASEATGAALLRAVPDPLLRIDRGGVVRDVRAAGGALAVPPEGLLGRRLAEILPPEVAGPAGSLVERALATGELQTYEYRLTADGATRDYEARLVPSGPDDVLAIVRDVTERRRAEATVRFLAEASAALAGSLDEEVTLAALARLAVPALADWCIVDVLDADGRPRRVAVETAVPAAGGAGSGSDLADRLRAHRPDLTKRAGVARVLAGDGPELVPEVDEVYLRALALGPDHLATLRAAGYLAASFLAVPLTARGRTLGALTLLATVSGRRYGPAELELAADLGRRAGLAVDNARLYREEREAARRADEARALLDTLIASAPVGLGFVDPELRYVRVNRALANANGLPVSAHPGKTVAEVLPELAPRLEPVMRRVLASGRKVPNLPIEGRAPHEPGRPGHWQAGFYPVPGPDGGRLGIGVVVTDVTAARRAEAASRFLAEASAALATSLDEDVTLAALARLAVPFLADWCIVDVRAEDGTLHRVAVVPADPAKAKLAEQLARHAPVPDRDAGIARVLRTGRAELIARVPTTFAPAVARDRAHLTALRRVGFRSYLGVPLTARDRILGGISLIAAESGRRFGPADVDLAEDLGRRAGLAVDNARLYSRLEELAAERSLTLGRIADGVITADAAGRVVFANEAAHRLHGGVEIGASVDAYVAAFAPRRPDGAPIPADELPLGRAVRCGETVLDAEWTIRRPDGAELAVQGSAAPIRSEGGTGSALGAVLTLRDVTAQRDFARQKDEFIVAASHDLKTPLTSIKGWAQLLRVRATREPTPARARDLAALNAIEDQAIAMQRLIERLLETTRLRLGEQPELRRADVDLAELAARLVAQHQVQTDRHRLRAVGAGPGEAVGWWDGDVLAQIVGNLLSNAIKYSPAGGPIEVTVAADPAAAEVRLRVRDEGLGIPPAALARVFDQFYRVPRGEEEAAPVEGSGLGLYGAQQLAAGLGGRIEAASEPGRGSTFTLVLPHTRRAADDPAPPPA